MIRSDNHIFAGMQRDTSVSKHQAQFLVDALNIRLTARDDKTSLSMTNEKGTKLLSFLFKEYNNSTGTWSSQSNVSLEGVYIGHCVLNEYLILFTYIDSSNSAIYRINLKTINNNSYIATRLYKGDLGFDRSFPIETVASYENAFIQKVYWTDNKNQPRVINIAPDKDALISSYTKYSFDFSPVLALNESVTVSKKYSGGSFASGVIQYAITYYNKYGHETPVVIVTPLYYVSPFGRGGSPEEICNNSFVINITGVDNNFEYLRIYSIHRTSINGTPICKRLQDIEIGTSTSIEYIDTGTNGDSVDPSSLFFLGGEEIKAETMCQKDGTLFFGNISLKRPSISSVKSSIESYFGTNKSSPVYIPTGNPSTEKIKIESRECNHSIIVSSGDFMYASTLEGNCAGFKNGEYYRLALQFQYKTGVWSEPIWITDYLMNGVNSLRNNTTLDGIPRNTILKTTLSSSLRAALLNIGYKKVRAMIATPSLTNRTRLFQGVYSPTMYRYCDRYGVNPNGDDRNTDVSSLVGHLYSQPSWIFRPSIPYAKELNDWKSTNYGGNISGGSGDGTLRSQYANDNVVTEFEDGAIVNRYSKYEYSTEIQGKFPYNSLFRVDNESFYIMATINSPDIIWDNDLANYSFASSKLSRVGYVCCFSDYADIDITTSSPTVGSLGSGFVHRAFKTDGYAGLLSQPCFQDNIVNDDSTTEFGIDDNLKYPVMWMVYMWHRNGSLNNDVNRAGRTAMLQTKKISNYRIADTWYYSNSGSEFSLTDIKLFTSDEVQYIKVDGKPYLGNIDTVLIPDNSGFYFTNNPTEDTWESNAVHTSALLNRLTAGKKNYNTDVGLWQKWDVENGTYKWTPSSGGSGDWTRIGDKVPGLCASREGIRMRYKSTPHAVVYGASVPPGSSIDDPYWQDNSNFSAALSLVEIYQTYNKNTLYGGTSDDALKAISWIPAGPAVSLSTDNEIKWLWGDTWYNRWDCLKTYAYSREDQNQVVDILSFPVESHINLDGRYDRNRGQSSNLNMSPINYNLMNMVYSQLDNFFSYRIMDNDYYNLNSFPNQITWTLEKVAGSSTDPWTQITLASTYDVDGSKGQIRALRTINNNIYCFQDTGICNIIFNPRVQIATSDGVPIEIGNSYKVEGKRYISESLGCTNKGAICESLAGLYFIDTVSQGLYSLSADGLSSVSDRCNMRTWFETLPQDRWTPLNFSTRLFYDNVHRDLYVVTQNNSICYSELLSQFVSFMSYEGVSSMFNIGSSFFSSKDTTSGITLWEMFAGDYNEFFGVVKPVSLSFISNADSAIDKTFLNLEIQADFYDQDSDLEGEPFPHKVNPLNAKSLNPKRFFDTIRIQNEYQDSGEVDLTWKNFRSFSSYSNFKDSNTSKKYRMWRVELPRDRSNTQARLYDRIRNTWAKITLVSNMTNTTSMELHNLSVKYFI